MEKNTEELTQIGTLASGQIVYGGANAHWKNSQKTVAETDLKEALGKINTTDAFVLESVDLGRVVGSERCVEKQKFEQVFNAVRKGKSGVTPTVINRVPKSCENLSVVLNKLDDGNYKLLTAYIGEIVPQEPWELSNCNDQEKVENSKQFWDNHVFVYDKSAIDHFVGKDGNEVSVEDFEKQYIYNPEKHKFNIEDKSLFMVMGVPGCGMNEKVNGYKAQLAAEGIDVNTFSFEDMKKATPKWEDTKIYDELVAKAKKSLEENKLTIVTGSFLFAAGDKARDELYQIVNDMEKPLRGLIIKMSVKDSLEINARKANPMNENSVIKMCESINEKYDAIRNEIKIQSNAKVASISGRLAENDKKKENDDRELA